MAFLEVRSSRGVPFGVINLPHVQLDAIDRAHRLIRTVLQLSLRLVGSVRRLHPSSIRLEGAASSKLNVEVLIVCNKRRCIKPVWVSHGIGSSIPMTHINRTQDISLKILCDVSNRGNGIGINQAVTA